jgi:hypothetical protein
MITTIHRGLLSLPKEEKREYEFEANLIPNHLRELFLRGDISGDF